MSMYDYILDVIILISDITMHRETIVSMICQSIHIDFHMMYDTSHMYLQTNGGKHVGQSSSVAMLSLALCLTKEVLAYMLSFCGYFWPQ